MEVLIWRDKDINEIPHQDNPFNFEGAEYAIVVCGHHREPGKTVGVMVVWTYSREGKCPCIRGEFPHEPDAILFANTIANK